LAAPIAVIAAIAGALDLTGCVTTTGQGHAAAQPVAQPARATVVVAAPPPPPRAPAVVVARPVVREELMPEHDDVYISAALDRDVVFVGGSTYIWVTGPDGRRHRHFYGRGDRRQEVFRRRDNLHSVAAHHAGHPPPHHAPRDDECRREAIRRAQQARVAAAQDHGHPPERHLAANERPHHPDAHPQPVPGHSRPSSHEVSAARAAREHQPSNGNAAMQGNGAQKS
jgi:hypothetical protein